MRILTGPKVADLLRVSMHAWNRVLGELWAGRTPGQRTVGVPGIFIAGYSITTGAFRGDGGLVSRERLQMTQSSANCPFSMGSIQPWMSRRLGIKLWTSGEFAVSLRGMGWISGLVLLFVRSLLLWLVVPLGLIVWIFVFHIEPRRRLSRAGRPPGITAYMSSSTTGGVGRAATRLVPAGSRR